MSNDKADATWHPNREPTALTVACDMGYHDECATYTLVLYGSDVIVTERCSCHCHAR